MQKQDNTRGLTISHGKVLTWLAPFFIAQNVTIHSAQESLPGIIRNQCLFLGKNYPKGSVCSEIAVCFKMKIDHENLHRNKAINIVRNPLTDHKLRRVVSKCSVWW